MSPHVMPWRCGTEISEDLWVQELEKKGAIASPLFNGVPDRIQHARACYDHIKRNPPHSAEVMIGVAGREHGYGTNPNSVLYRNDTRSFTNARSIQTAGVKGEIITDSERRSQYVKYDTALDSIKDGIGRVDKPGFDYQLKNAVTIADVVRIWAPAEDANDPEGYAWFVFNVLMGLRSRMLVPVHGGDSPLVAWIAADSNHYTKGRTVTWPDVLGQHHSDGFDSLLWLTTSPNSEVSSHYLTNPNGSLRAQLVRHQDTAHTNAGWNHRTLTMEWERYWSDPAMRQHANGVPADIYRRLAEGWTHVVLVERGRGNPNFAKVPARWQLKGHNEMGNTGCPMNLDIGRLYEGLAQQLEAVGKPGLHPGMRLFEQTGKVMYGGFRSFYEDLESIDPALPLRVVGLPKSNEGWAIVAGEQRRVQFGERGVLVWNQGANHPWDVTLMHRAEIDAITAFEEDPVAA